MRPEEVVPPLKDASPAELLELARQPLVPLEVASDRKYLLSLRHGIFVDRPLLWRLLEGKAVDSNEYPKS